jgi:hypothetical protein
MSPAAAQAFRHPVLMESMFTSLSKAIERIFERQARSRLTLAGERGLGLSSVSCLVGVANLSRLNFSIIIGLMSRRCFSPKKSLSVTERCSSSR